MRLESCFWKISRKKHAQHDRIDKIQRQGVNKNRTLNNILTDLVFYPTEIVKFDVMFFEVKVLLIILNST